VWVGALVALVVGTTSTTQAAFTYNFVNVSSASSATNNAAVQNGQILMTVDAVVGNPNQVSFLFNNNSSVAAVTIKEIYFDDGSLLGIAQVINGTGVNFTQFGVAPPDLPAPGSLNFQTTTGFSLDQAGNNATGVQSGEFVQVIFDLQTGRTVTDIITALQWSIDNPNNTGGGPSGGLRVGIHVGSLPSSPDSQAFINGPQNPPGAEEVTTPAPGGLVLVASVLPFAWGLRRRLTRKEVAA